MNKSRLIYVLQSLTPFELRSLKKFVRSPLYNRRQDVVDLLDYLALNLGKDGVEKRDKVSVFEAIFPNIVYHEMTINYTMSYLFKLLKQFLAWQEWQADELSEQIYLTKAMRKKGLQKQFETELKQGVQGLQKQALRSRTYYYKKFQLEEERYLAAAGKKRKDMAGFEEHSNALNQYFIIHQLRQSCFAFSHQTVSKTVYQQDFQQRVLELVETKDYRDVPAIQVYFFCYKMLIEPEETTHFQTLNQLLKTHHPLFPNSELKDIYLLKINFCVKKINTGQHEFFRPIFELYQDGLALGIFLENGYLSRFTYKNISSTALHLNEFEWVEQFLKSHKKSIEPAYQESAFHFNMAILCYRKKDYHGVLQFLQQSEFDDVLENCIARQILLRTYFEMDEVEALMSLLESFKNYIYRHRKHIGYHRESYANLIKFTKKLVQSQYHAKAQAVLKEAVVSTKFVADRAWLLEQLEQA